MMQGIPYILGRYRLQGTKLGRGNYATVEQAVHMDLETHVAVKMIDTRAVRDPYVMRNLHREASMLRRLKHPNILAIFEALRAGDLYCIVTELVAGGELVQYVSRQPGGHLDESTALVFAAQLVSALAHMHEMGVVHRDLKMKNIMLTQGCHAVKIVDFGLSNTWTPSKPLRTHCGSPGYAAPEIYMSSRTYGPEVDLWSLGVVLYGMAVGRLPFQASRDRQDSAQERRKRLLAQLVRGATEHHLAAMQHFSAAFRDLVQGLLTAPVARRLTLKQTLEHPWLARRLRARQMLCTPYRLSSKEHALILTKLAIMLNMTVAAVQAHCNKERLGEVAAMYNILSHKQLSSYHAAWGRRRWRDPDSRPRHGRSLRDTDPLVLGGLSRNSLAASPPSPEDPEDPEDFENTKEDSKDPEDSKNPEGPGAGEGSVEGSVEDLRSMRSRPPLQQHLALCSASPIQTISLSSDQLISSRSQRRASAGSVADQHAGSNTGPTEDSNGGGIGENMASSNGGGATKDESADRHDGGVREIIADSNDGGVLITERAGFNGGGVMGEDKIPDSNGGGVMGEDEIPDSNSGGVMGEDEIPDSNGGGVMGEDEIPDSNGGGVIGEERAGHTQDSHSATRNEAAAGPGAEDGKTAAYPLPTKSALASLAGIPVAKTRKAVSFSIIGSPSTSCDKMRGRKDTSVQANLAWSLAQGSSDTAASLVQGSSRVLRVQRHPSPEPRKSLYESRRVVRVRSPRALYKHLKANPTLSLSNFLDVSKGREPTRTRTTANSTALCTEIATPESAPAILNQPCSEDASLALLAVERHLTDTPSATKTDNEDLLHSENAEAPSDLEKPGRKVERLRPLVRPDTPLGPAASSGAHRPTDAALARVSHPKPRIKVRRRRKAQLLHNIIPNRYRVDLALVTTVERSRKLHIFQMHSFNMWSSSAKSSLLGNSKQKDTHKGDNPRTNERKTLKKKKSSYTTPRRPHVATNEQYKKCTESLKV